MQAFALLREMEFLLWTAFPNDDSGCRLIYLGLEQISRKWKMPIKRWKAVVTVCDPLRRSFAVRSVGHNKSRIVTNSVYTKILICSHN